MSTACPLPICVCMYVRMYACLPHVIYNYRVIESHLHDMVCGHHLSSHVQECCSDTYVQYIRTCMCRHMCVTPMWAYSTYSVFHFLCVTVHVCMHVVFVCTFTTSFFQQLILVAMRQTVDHQERRMDQLRLAL